MTAPTTSPDTGGEATDRVMAVLNHWFDGRYRIDRNSEMVQQLAALAAAPLPSECGGLGSSSLKGEDAHRDAETAVLGWQDWPRAFHDRRYEVGIRAEQEPALCPFCDNHIDQTCDVTIVGGDLLSLAHTACIPDECLLPPPAASVSPGIFACENEPKDAHPPQGEAEMREKVARLLFVEDSPHESWDSFDERFEARGNRHHPMQEKAFRLADIAILALTGRGKADE